MNILLIGSGGREHALAWKIKQSSKCDTLFIAPGNGGTNAIGSNVAIDPLDFEAVATFCLKEQVKLIVCGPELPAVKGIWDYFEIERTSLGIHVIAPSKIAANLEGSKSFAKQFMQRHHIPTAQYIEVHAENLNEGLKWFEEGTPPYVIKADGLAEGKGVVIATSKETASETLINFISHKQFGDSSTTVVLEEFLDGIECSIFVYTNGIQYAILPNAKDYKRRFEGNQGLNTGGMGCISPVPFVDEALMQKIESEIIIPTIKGLEKEQMPYVGFVYFGLIIVKGQPKVIEYNCRLGDPETQVILPRFENDLIDLFESGFSGTLHQFPTKISNQHCAVVIAVSDGYPEAYQKGYSIEGIDTITHSIVFQAGTKISDSEIVTNGGRVLAVTSLGNSLSEALNTSYQSLSKVHFNGMKYRNDIGFEFI
jgi:phosphoribosylamine--glycine ligase